MSKTTPLSAQNQLTSAINGYHDRADAIKKDYRAKRESILQNDRLSDAAKTADLTRLADEVNTQIKSVRTEQESYVSGLKTRLEKELRGNQPTDANSVLLRRDASDRARKIDNEKDALAVLSDAISNGDVEMAHAIGAKARHTGWIDAAETWQAAHPDTAGVAEALAYVEASTSGAAYNLATSMAFSDPSA